MAKNKKEEIVYKYGNLELPYQPSKYQEAIFDFILHKHGNLVIEASAGSGKTTTLLNILKLIHPSKKVLFAAFNTDIVKEIKMKTVNFKNVDVRTIHSLGFILIKRNLGDEIQIKEGKYKEYITSYVNEHRETLCNITPRNILKFINNITNLCDYARYNLAENEDDLDKLVKHHGMELVGNEIQLTLDVLEWGKNHTTVIDYTDMVWFPYVLHLKPLGTKYDWLLLDEAQDQSIAQRELVLRCQRMGTRIIFVGDENQSIYAFASASPEAFRLLKRLPNTTSLPLSISYRCPKKVVKFAQNYVPTIEYKEDAIDGDVVYDAHLEDVNGGDMILCRNNAPLMQVYNSLIRMGKPCFIRGKDIGSNLVKVVETFNQEFLHKDLTKDGLFVRLYDDLFSARRRISETTNLDKASIMKMSVISNKLDIINALTVLADGLKTTEELINRIKVIFSDEKATNKQITLSTIHKAKGLESDNVFIACKSLMPAKSVTQEWEQVQEHNLMYVAYTRSKRKLAFLDEKGFESFTSETVSSDYLRYAEVCVSRLLNKSYGLIEKLSANTISHIIERSQPVVKPTIGVGKTLGSKKQPSSLRGNNRKKYLNHE